MNILLWRVANRYLYFCNSVQQHEFPGASCTTQLQAAMYCSNCSIAGACVLTCSLTMFCKGQYANVWNVLHALHTCSPSLHRKSLPLFAFTHSLTGLPSPLQSRCCASSSKPAENQLKTSSKHCAGLRPTDIVMDLFCGTGSIGLTLAQDCHHVYGFESTASSVADARRNAEVNGISNATFVHGDLTKVAAMMGKQYPNPDVIVTGGLFCE